MSDNDLIFKTGNSNVRRNLAKYDCLTAYSRSLHGSHDAPDIHFGKNTAFQPGHYASIDDFDLKEYMSRHYPSESQKIPGKCQSDIS